MHKTAGKILNAIEGMRRDNYIIVPFFYFNFLEETKRNKKSCDCTKSNLIVPLACRINHIQSDNDLHR